MRLDSSWHTSRRPASKQDDRQGSAMLIPAPHSGQPARGFHFFCFSYFNRVLCRLSYLYRKRGYQGVVDTVQSPGICISQISFTGVNKGLENGLFDSLAVARRHGPFVRATVGFAITVAFKSEASVRYGSVRFHRGELHSITPDTNIPFASDIPSRTGIPSLTSCHCRYSPVSRPSWSPRAPASPSASSASPTGS